MYITVLAFGTPGDVNPLLAVARGLHSAGHNVRFATHRRWADEVTNSGLEFAVIHGDVQALVTDEAFLKVLEAGRRPDRLLRGLHCAASQVARRHEDPAAKGPWARMNTLLEVSRSFDDAVISDIWSSSEGCDALVYGAPLAFHGYYAARARGVRSAAALIQPLDYRDRVLPQQVMWQMFRGPVRRWQRGMGYPPAPLAGPFRQWRAENLPIVYGLSPSVFPGLGGAPDRYATGFWFLDSQQGPLPDKVEAFLADGEPPVYFSFGSMPAREPERLTEIVMAAVERSGDRALLATGWGGLAASDGSTRVLCVDDLPHDLLFPRVRAAVHHGGVMITAQGLRAGRPTVVIPSVLDQFGWGRRIAALGVGPEPVPRRRLDPIRLAEALIATREERIRVAAADLGDQIRAEHGIDLAVSALEKVFQA